MESGLLVAKAQRQNSQTSLENARLQLSYNTIVAPTGGRTSKRSAEMGTYVQPGQTLIAIVDPELWLVAEADVLRAEAKLHQAERDWQRTENLRKKNQVPAAEVDQYRANLLALSAPETALTPTPRRLRM